MSLHAARLFGNLSTTPFYPLLGYEETRFISHYSFQKGAHHLYISRSSLNLQQIEEIRYLPAEFALTVENEILFFLWKFGSQVWSHSPYSWYLLPKEDRFLPNLWGPAMLQIHLISTGCEEQLLRTIHLPEDFSLALQGAILLQSTKHWKGLSSYEKALKEVYLRYPTGESLIPFATARTAKL